VTFDVFLDKKRLKVRNGESPFWSLTPPPPNLGKVLLLWSRQVLLVFL
jgi:hypothetical protein